MAQAFSFNMGHNLPIPSKSSSRYFCPSGLIHFPHVLKLKPIRALAGDAREKLDHWPRHSKHQSPPKRRVAPVAPIGLWVRFPTARTVQEMMEAMERIMEDPFALSTLEWPSSSLPSEAGGGYWRGRTPWEIKEGEGEYKMRFDVPGMTKEDVKVWVEEKMLVVQAEKTPKKKSTLQQNGQEVVQQDPREKGGEEEEDEDEEWSAKSYDRYSSRIAFPENVQFEKIKAEVRDGVLYITIPKPSSTSSNVLEIHVQ